MNNIAYNNGTCKEVSKHIRKTIKNNMNMKSVRY